MGVVNDIVNTNIGTIARETTCNTVTTRGYIQPHARYRAEPAGAKVAPGTDAEAGRFRYKQLMHTCIANHEENKRSKMRRV